AAVRSIAVRFPNVHLVLCPHDGPTSKADCLNWIYQHVGLFEEEHREYFDTIVIHDAEDLIHPDELLWINYYSARFDFIQTPVLALATPFADFIHGIYCDEFAEYHTRDMAVRLLLGGFLPSAGVGTGYRRDALEKLAESASNRLFEPEALTEDYENGLRLFRLGCSQAFVPLLRSRGRRNFVATREFFPRSFRAALRQRTRWVLGNSLQAWQRYGWGRSAGEAYWLWRDRKGLIASPLGFAANLVFLYGLAAGIWTRVPPLASDLVYLTAALTLVRLAVRMACVGRIYGFAFALGVPLRAIYANALNASAAVEAIGRFVLARAMGRPLKWVKTGHSFPSRASHTRRLGEILIGSGEISARALKSALASQPRNLRLGEYLLREGAIGEAAVYRALGIQQGFPVTALEPEQVPRRVARAVPQSVSQKWRVLPFRVAEGSLFLATPEIPSDQTVAALHGFTSLKLNFHLMTPSEFEKLSAALL
ncbi:MAG: glycosyltransferase family 2 protein, partial [Bryobacteraceae bacterium]